MGVTEKTDRAIEEAIADFIESCDGDSRYETEIAVPTGLHFNASADVPDLEAIASAIRSGAWKRGD